MADHRNGDGSPEISPVLFLAVSGASMRFFLRPGPTKVQLQPLIRAGGGCVCRVQEPGAILLADPEEAETLPQSAAHWYVSTQYIRDCVERNMQLELVDYRFNCEHAQTSSPRHVRGSNSKRGEGGRGARRRTYTVEEDDAILRYIRKRKMETSGNAVWQELEKHQVLNRSWQSMKDRYRKYLMYRGKEEEQEEEQEEDQEEEEQEEEQEEEEAAKEKEEEETEKVEEDVAGSDTVQSLPASCPPVEPGVLEPSTQPADSHALTSPPPPPSSSADALETSLTKEADQNPPIPQGSQTTPSPQKKRTLPKSPPHHFQHNRDLPEDPKSPSSKRVRLLAERTTSSSKSPQSPSSKTARLLAERTTSSSKSPQSEVTTAQASPDSVQSEETLSPSKGLQSEETLSYKSVQPEKTLSSKSVQSEETLSSKSVQSEETLSSKGAHSEETLEEEEAPSSRDTEGMLEQRLPAAAACASGVTAATVSPKEGESEGKRKLGILEQATREFEVTTDESEEEEEEETPKLEDTRAVCVAVSMTTTSMVCDPVTSPSKSTGATAASQPGLETQGSTDSVLTEAAGPGPAPCQPDPQTSRAHLFLFEHESQPITNEDTVGCSSGQPMTNSDSAEGAVSLTQCQLEEDKQLMRMLIKESNTDLVSVTKALLKTSGDVGAALQYLLTSGIATPLWSCHDDRLLLSGDSLELNQLREKHGEEAMAKRLAFLA